MARTAHHRMTYDDLLALPDDGLRHELIDGEHYVSPAPNTKHQIVSANLAGLLVPFVKAHDLGRVFTAPYDVVFTEHNVVEPDLLFIARERLGLLTDAHLPAAPDLVIEILSPSSRRIDGGAKRDLYARMGVREYWLVDPRDDTVTSHRRTDEAFHLVAKLSAEAGDTLATPLLPGLAITVAEIFE